MSTAHRSRFHEFSGLLGLVIAAACLYGFFAWQMPGRFGDWETVERITRQGSYVAIAAIGMTFVIVSGGIDLSVGSVVAFVTVCIAWLLERNIGPGVALLGGIGSGVLSGALNGFLVTRFRLGAFIVTLGTMLIFRGLAKGMADEMKIDAPLTWLNSLLQTLNESNRWMLFPAGVWAMIVLAAIAGIVLRSSVFGRHSVAIGSNEVAARLSGVRVERVRLFVYCLMGLFVGIAGVLQFSKLSVGDPTVAQGMELDVIAAVVIGGASLSGGSGSILGSLLGALIMATIRAGFSQMGIPNWLQEIATGSIIVLAIGLDRLRSRRTSHG